ncbi:MAG: phage minor head protein [Candidatus Hodarchaeota archaeon]
MYQFTSLQDLSTEELLELLYFVEEIKVEKEEFVYFYNGLNDIQKRIFVNTDVEERKIRDIVEKFLLKSEKESLKELYRLSEKRLEEIKRNLEDIKLEKRFKKYGIMFFGTKKQTLPIKVKQLNLGDIDKISDLKLSDLEKQLNDIEFKIAQKGATKAKIDLGLQNVPRVTAVKGNIASRVRDFTDNVGVNIKSKLKAEILAGIKAGEGTSDIAKRIRSVYRKPVPVEVKPLYREGKLIRAGYSYDISNKRWSEMVARTESSWSVNKGRLEAYKSSELVKNVEWETADNPCEACAAMEGQILELYEAENMIPYHVHCKCTWTVYEYKKEDEKLPEPPSMFSDELYEHPDGVGITGIIKMRPGAEKVFNRALELGNYRLAEKIMRHHHISLSMIDYKQIERISDFGKAFNSEKELITLARGTVTKALGTSRTLSNGKIINEPAKIKFVSTEEASKVLHHSVETTGGYYSHESDTISVILRNPIKDSKASIKEGLFDTTVHEIVHSYGNHFGTIDVTEGFTEFISKTIVWKSGSRTYFTGFYEKYANDAARISMAIGKMNKAEVRKFLQKIAISNTVQADLVKELSVILNKPESQLTNEVTAGLSYITKKYANKFPKKMEVISFLADIYKRLSDLMSLQDNIGALSDESSKKEIKKLIGKFVKEYQKLPTKEKDKLGLVYTELLAFSELK